MKHADIIDRHRCHEPAFDLPPRFTGVHDRRLGGRVAAHWGRDGDALSVPLADALRAIGGNLVWLRWYGDVVFVDDAGAAVTATFGVRAGPLPTHTAFARALGDAAVTSRSIAAPVSFEGGYSRRHGAPPTLLTRGVVVPLDRDGGGDAAPTPTACAVVTWTELLAPADNDRLRRELLSALALPRHPSPVAAPAMW